MRQRLETIHPRHREVEQNQVDLERPGELDRLEAVPGLPDHMETAAAFEQQPEQGPQHVFVIDEHHTLEPCGHGHGVISRRKPPLSIAAVESISLSTRSVTISRAESSPRSSASSP